jgi:hypothetical protein
VAAAGYVIIRPRVRRTSVIPDGLEDAIGTALFAAAGLGLLALGVQQLRFAANAGAGAYLSEAIVALPVAIVYAKRLHSTLRTRELAMTSTG